MWEEGTNLEAIKLDGCSHLLPFAYQEYSPIGIQPFTNGPSAKMEFYGKPLDASLQTQDHCCFCSFSGERAARGKEIKMGELSF